MIYLAVAISMFVMFFIGFITGFIVGAGASLEEKGKAEWRSRSGLRLNT